MSKAKVIQEEKKRNYKKDASWIALTFIAGGFIARDVPIVIIGMFGYIILTLWSW